MVLFDNSFSRLPGSLFVRESPSAVARPELVVWNEELSKELGLTEAEWDADILTGNRLPIGAEPIAQAYAGHQFGHFTMLGDGRALLLGELVSRNGKRVDVQLKGSGRTRFSRGGDGRAVMGPMLREYIIGEGLNGLGIPTTRALAVCGTGEPVYRERSRPGAVLTRVAASHIRVGTFQYAAAWTDTETLAALVDHTLLRHFPDQIGSPRPALALLESVIASQASLVAKWMLVGFVHGVMNTDNMALSGESIDFGPCAFLDRHHPGTVFSSIDTQGRYAYGNQPDIALWNLCRLAEALLPLIDPDETRSIELARAALESFAGRYSGHWFAGMRKKLGLFTQEEGDETLARSFVDSLVEEGADHTLHFARLDPDRPPAGEWGTRWRDRLTRQPQSSSEVRALLHSSNPVYIPRNHKVEEALAAAEEGDTCPLQRLVEALRSPFDRTREGLEDLQQPAPGDAPPYRTFCGT